MSYQKRSITPAEKSLSKVVAGARSSLKASPESGIGVPYVRARSLRLRGTASLFLLQEGEAMSDSRSIAALARSIAALLMLLVLGTEAPRSAAPPYSVTDLGTFGTVQSAQA